MVDSRRGPSDPEALDSRPAVADLRGRDVRFGLAMDGKIYQSNTGDLLDILGFIGDLGTGALYILGRMLDWGGTAIYIAAADYGTKFIVVAGLLNIISAWTLPHCDWKETMMLALQLSHFTAASLFAFFFFHRVRITQRNTPKEMVRYGAYCFGVFMIGMWVAGG